MIFRILSGSALLLLGYYIGREVGRAESIRKELENTREPGKQTRKGKTREEKNRHTDIS